MIRFVDKLLTNALHLLMAGFNSDINQVVLTRSNRLIRFIVELKNFLSAHPGSKVEGLKLKSISSRD